MSQKKAGHKNETDLKKSGFMHIINGMRICHKKQDQRAFHIRQAEVTV